MPVMSGVFRGWCALMLAIAASSAWATEGTQEKDLRTAFDRYSWKVVKDATLLTEASIQFERLGEQDRARLLRGRAREFAEPMELVKLAEAERLSGDVEQAIRDLGEAERQLGLKKDGSDRLLQGVALQYALVGRAEEVLRVIQESGEGARYQSHLRGSLSIRLARMGEYEIAKRLLPKHAGSYYMAGLGKAAARRGDWEVANQVISQIDDPGQSLAIKAQLVSQMAESGMFDNALKIAKSHADRHERSALLAAVSASGFRDRPERAIELANRLKESLLGVEATEIRMVALAYLVRVYARAGEVAITNDVLQSLTGHQWRNAAMWLFSNHPKMASEIGVASREVCRMFDPGEQQDYLKIVQHVKLAPPQADRSVFDCILKEERADPKLSARIYAWKGDARQAGHALAKVSAVRRVGGYQEVVWILLKRDPAAARDLARLVEVPAVRQELMGAIYARAPEVVSVQELEGWGLVVAIKEINSMR